MPDRSDNVKRIQRVSRSQSCRVKPVRRNAGEIMSGDLQPCSSVLCIQRAGGQFACQHWRMNDNATMSAVPV